MITVRLLYFAQLREIRGCDAEDMSVPAETTIEQLYRQVFASQGAKLPTVAFARNATVCPGSTALANGDEVAFLPPLGGG